MCWSNAGRNWSRSDPDNLDFNAAVSALGLSAEHRRLLKSAGADRSSLDRARAPGGADNRELQRDRADAGKRRDEDGEGAREADFVSASLPRKPMRCGARSASALAKSLEANSKG